MFKFHKSSRLVKMHHRCVNLPRIYEHNIKNDPTKNGADTVLIFGTTFLTGLFVIF